MNKVKIKDIVDIYNGSTPSTSISENFDGNISWITPKDISDQKSKYIYRGERNITEKGLKSIGGSLLPKGTILFSSRAPIGLMSISKVETSTNQGFKNMVCKKGKVHNEYLYYLLKTQIAKIQELGTGTTFKEVSKSTIENFKLYIVEDLPTQQKIAAVLSALDDKIELNNTINSELEAMAKTLYDYWFVQFEFPNSEGKPYKSSGGTMEYNAILKREIPKGWEVKNLFECVNVQYGFPFSTDYFNETETGIPVIRIRDILNNSISNYSTQENIDKKYLISEGDVLIGMDGNFHVNYWTRENCYLNQRVVMLKETFLPNIFIRYQVEPYIQLREKSVSRTTVGHLSDKDLKAINIIVPTNEILNVIKPLFDSTLKKIVKNKQQNQELAQLRDWLLPMLMNGQVKVVDHQYNSANNVVSMAAESKTNYKKNKQADNYKKIQILYSTVWFNNSIGAKQGEMATTKDVYLLDRIYGLNTGFQFAKHNWGSFDPKEKQLLNTTQYFHKPKFPNSKAFYIDVKDEGKLLEKIPNEIKTTIQHGIEEMNQIVFKNYFGTKKAEAKELFATILQCIEDSQSLELHIIREEMKNWKIKQAGKKTTKAEKFSEAETKEALTIIIDNNWHANVLKK